MEFKNPATLIQHFAEPKKTGDPVVPPIVQTSLFVFDTVEEYWETAKEPQTEAPFVYSRCGNPTLHILEQKLAALEKADECRVFGSGMGAISCAIFSSVKAGSHVVAVDTCYGPTRQLLSDYLPKFGVSVTYVDGRTPESVFEAIKPETSLVYLESPGSILFRIQDLRAIGQECKRRGITTICDNSYSTPLVQRPIEFGIDIVVHSGTKYLAGHSDLCAGVLCCDSARMAEIVKLEHPLFGAALAPFPAWLMLRGLRTLEIRLQRHAATANQVAAFLASHPQVEKVNHVFGPGFEQSELARTQMSGNGGLLSFHPKFTDIEKVKRFANSLDIFQIGVSWGGFESLCVPIWYHPMDWSEPGWAIRLYCGLEAPEDLISALEKAFEAV